MLRECRSEDVQAALPLRVAAAPCRAHYLLKGAEQARNVRRRRRVRRARRGARAAADAPAMRAAAAAASSEARSGKTTSLQVVGSGGPSVGGGCWSRRAAGGIVGRWQWRRQYARRSSPSCEESRQT